MKYPDCTHNVPHGVKTILVALATGTCFWEAEPEKVVNQKRMLIHSGAPMFLV